MISSEIRKFRPGFNIGVTTSTGGSPRSRWEASYRHWVFVPESAEYESGLTKRVQRKKK